jgi:hypothetical protein
MNKELFDQSSDVTVWNLYDQDFQTIVDEGLASVFADRAEFEQTKHSKQKREEFK